MITIAWSDKEFAAMRGSIVAFLTALGIVAMAGAAAACPMADTATSTGQQTVMAPPAPQTPMPGKPGG
jgi:hypothetical protein